MKTEQQIREKIAELEALMDKFPISEAASIHSGCKDKIRTLQWVLEPQ